MDGAHVNVGTTGANFEDFGTIDIPSQVFDDLKKNRGYLITTSTNSLTVDFESGLSIHIYASD